MIQKISDRDIEVKILDFGNACTCTTDRRNGGKGMKSDFLNALRIFSALYFGDEFNDQLDLKENWREKLIIRVCTILTGHNLTTVEGWGCSLEICIHFGFTLVCWW